MFMARAVRAGRPLGEVGDRPWYQMVPELSQKAHVYGDVFPDRLTRFQCSPGSPDDHIVRVGARPDLSSWRHELRHDAESVFWLLVWWAVNAAAPTAGSTSKIPIGMWASLVDTNIDIRPLNIASDSLDPAYAPLSELLNQLGQALKFDLHWATGTPYTHPEFLHEVFQRHILNFIVEYRGEKFINLAKGDASRKPADVSATPSLLSPQIDSIRSRSGGSNHSKSVRSCYSFLIYNCFTSCCILQGKSKKSKLIADSL